MKVTPSMFSSFRGCSRPSWGCLQEHKHLEPSRVAAQELGPAWTRGRTRHEQGRTPGGCFWGVLGFIGEQLSVDGFIEASA